MVDDGIQNLSIKERLAFLAKDSLIYGGAGALSKAFSLITFPLLARYFSVLDYGLIDLFFVTTSLIAIFFIFGQDSGVARYFYEYEDNDTRREIVSESLFFQLAFLMIMLPVLWYFCDSLATILSSDHRASGLVEIILMQMPFYILINFSQNLLKWTFSRTQFLIISLGSMCLNVFFILIGVIFFKMGIEGLFIVSLIVKCGFGLLGLYYVRQWVHVPRGFGYLGELLRFAIPFGIICVVGAFVPVVERSLISNLLGGKELGLYAAATRVVMLVNVVIEAFNTAWGPFSLAIHKQENAVVTYNVVLKSFVLIMCVFVLFLSVVAEPIIFILASSKYMGASIVVFPLAMGLAVQAVGGITELGISISKKSFMNLYCHSVFLIVSIISMYYLAYAFGAVGIAMGSLCGHVSKAVMVSILSQRVHSIAWSYLPVVIVGSMTLLFGMAGVVTQAYAPGFVSSFVFFVGLVVVAISGIHILFDINERSRIISFLQQKLRRV